MVPTATASPVVLPDPGRHAWHRLVGAWHAGYAVLMALTLGLLLVDPPGSGRLGPALALLAALAGWYAAVGARALHRASARRSVLYLGVAVPATLALIALAPPAAVLLGVVYAHIWAMLGPRAAVVATAAVAVLGTAAVFGPSVGMLLIGAISLVAAVGVGLWISRIIQQSDERAELIADLAAARSDLAEVSHRAGILAERERLAADLHDTVAQGATSVLLQLEALEAELRPGQDAARGHLNRARDSARANLDEVRALVGALAPPQLEDTSLPDALRRIVDRMGPRLATQASVTVTGTPRPLPPDRELVALRAGQEALANAGRHAAATTVRVHLHYHDDGLTLRVTDDGHGFDADAPRTGYGLAGLDARVAGVGGRFALRAGPGTGVDVRVDLVG